MSDHEASICASPSPGSPNRCSFTGSTLDLESGTLTIYDNALSGPQTISLQGQASPASAKVSASHLTFSSPKVGKASTAQTVTVTNGGTLPLLMAFGDPGKSNPVVSSSYAGNFAILTDTCDANTIPAGATCTFSVDYTSSTSNTETGTIDIYDNASSQPQQIAISGTIAK